MPPSNPFPMLPPPTPLWPRASDPAVPLPPGPPVPWYKDIGKILLLIAALSGLVNTVVSGVNSVISSWHGEKIDHITTVQAANTVRLEDTATNVQAAASAANAAKAKADVTDVKLDAIKTELKAAPAAVANELKKGDK